MTDTTAPLAPPPALTCPKCGTGLADAGLATCPECGVELGAGPPPPLPTPLSEDGAPPPIPAPGSGDRPDMPVLGGIPAGTPAATTAAPAPADLPVEKCPQCGGTIDTDGYCTQCGASRPDPRHHVEEAPTAWAAGVCDRGIHHAGNEDAMALWAEGEAAGRAALVVCDGVTTAQRSAEASEAAADAAVGVLRGARSTGVGVAAARDAALGARLDAAADAASGAVAEVTETLVAQGMSGDSLPSCTFVAAVVEESVVAVGTVGDSRAYWFPDEGEARLLTTDDSLAQERIKEGADRAEAEKAADAHTITRWIGVDAPDHTPDKTVLEVDAPGWLLLCTDGLWNYASSPDELGTQVRSALEAGGGIPLGGATELVRWATEQGGRDNITAVLARLGAGAPEPVAPQAHPAQQSPVEATEAAAAEPRPAEAATTETTTTETTTTTEEA
ncbi:MAG: protein phosphatase 2C domain-containing protein [Micrococcales bacterium]|nr:protein phosphatase 2C domain-containing protein [Micrococcales bacterium]